MGHKELEHEDLAADDREKILRYSPTVYRMAYAMLKNRYDAEDIHQEVFVRYLRKRPKFESGEHERAWFLRVTVNLCKNLWKTAWRRKVVGSEDPDREKTAEQGGRTLETREAEDRLIELVKGLPQKYRAVIHLFYYEELSVDEIAKTIGAKPSTVRVRLNRARGRLKELLEKESGGL